MLFHICNVCDTLHVCCKNKVLFCSEISLFICQVYSARRQRNDHTVFESLPPVYHASEASHYNAERQAGKL